MPDYRPPVDEMKFLLRHVVPISGLKRDDLDPSMIDAILDEAGRLAENVIAPLNAIGDKTGAKFSNGQVTMPAGLKAAYDQYCDSGWNAVPFDSDYGGQGLPWLISFPVQEMWQAANMAFGLCPLLNQGAVDAIHAHGTPDQKAMFLPRLISGEWTGTMNLTEPQAGSDLSLLRARAVPHQDGSYRIRGQKIFITYGEHDLSDNIVHLVLARLPDAPEGTRGISLFIVPKYLDDGNGAFIRANDLACVSIEHKLGIHASPTCTMQFGDREGAIGYLLGRENEGLKCMFTMMNNARLSVGLQGIAIADRAYQAAVFYARERRQGRSSQSEETAAIIEHADIRRQLMTMRALIEGARGLAYQAAIYLDRAKDGDDDAQGLVELLTPVVKSFATDIGVEISSLAIQVYGGMGYIEETGVAQYYRDARILPIYEGTNGIQANDLIFRKIRKDGGKTAMAWIATAKADGASSNETSRALDRIADLTTQITAADNIDRLSGVASPYLKAFGIVATGYMLDRAVQAAADHCDADFAATKQATASFFADNILPQATALCEIVSKGLATDLPGAAIFGADPA